MSTAVYENHQMYPDPGKPNKPIMKISPQVMKKRFLAAFPYTGHIGKTCSMIGICTRTVHHWKKNDPEFAAEFLEAQEMAVSILEDAALMRAVYGVDKPVYQGKKLVGYIKEYSDTLLVLLLKANAPNKYKDRFAGELTGADGRPLNGTHQIIHIHSNVPMAEAEEDIDMTKQIEDIPHEVVPPAPLPNATEEELDELLR